MRTLALILAATTFVVSVHADSLKAEILSMDKKVCSALEKGDIKAFEKYTRSGVTKDFVYSEAGQNMNYDQMLEQVKQSMKQGKVTSASSTLLKLDLHGNTATATSKHVMKMNSKGADKKNHVMVMSGKSVDTYVKSGTTWKMSKMNWVSSDMTMDGKPMSMGKMPAGKSKTTGH